MRKNIRVIIILVILFTMVLLIPIGLDWLIIGNNVPSNISNADWVNFFGGYIGAIFGALVALAGIIVTIRYTNRQNRISHELQIRPHCVIRLVADCLSVQLNKRLGYITIGCEPRSNNGPTHKSIIYVKNIGLGPAIEFKIEAGELKDGRDHYLTFIQSTPELRHQTINYLQPGEEAALPIMIDFNFDPILEHDFIDLVHEGSTMKYLSPKTLNKYKSFDWDITFKYFDMFHNEYIQKITIGFSMSYKTIQNKTGEHICNLYAKKITSPERSKQLITGSDQWIV